MRDLQRRPLFCDEQDEEREEGCAIQTVLTERDKWHLRRARDLVDEVTRLRENLKEAELHTISSPNMDGMPKGSSDGDAMTRQYIRKDKLQAKLRGAERAQKRSRTIAEKALRNVRAPMRMFCEAYFLDASTAEEACAYARIDKRTGERYSAEINRTE